MPFAYVAHLRSFILIWLALLPPLFCTQVGWLALPAQFLVVVLFLGLDSISGEIENPFGYDWNDLPLDELLENLVKDLQQVRILLLLLLLSCGVFWVFWGGVVCAFLHAPGKHAVPPEHGLFWVLNTARGCTSGAARVR